MKAKNVKKFDNFNYQSVESTHKGFQEVLVTFEYKGKACHYYSFIKEKAASNKKYYLDEAKKEVKVMIMNGELEKRAKRYLNYELKDEDRLVVTSKYAKSTAVLMGKAARVHKPRPALPYIMLCAFGVLCLAAGVVTFLRRMWIVQWPEYVLEEAEVFSAKIHLYTAIGFGVLAIASLAVGIPLLIKKLKNK